MKFFGYHVVALAIAVATAIMIVILMPGCASVPKVPQTVTVVVEKFKPLPAWATDPLVKPAPADGTVAAHLKSENDRGAVIDYANCVRKLLKAIDTNGSVDAKDCKP